MWVAETVCQVVSRHSTDGGGELELLPRRMSRVKEPTCAHQVALHMTARWEMLYLPPK